MREAKELVIALFLVVCISVGLAEADESFPSSSIPLDDLFWLASYVDESPRTETNYADIVQASDEYGDYYGMAWNSPEDTDLTIGELDQYDLSGVTAIKLTLSATERITVRPYAGLGGEYCGKIGRFAVADPIIVGPDCQDYEFDVSGFGEEDPLRGCSGPLAEDALESLYSMVLLPDDRAGELRVYAVQLCGETIAVAEDEPEDDPVTPEIPAFSIDPDVTLDSVVQIGDGPQVLSTDIKFYPNTRRAKPVGTVYWTLEIGEGSGLEPPFTIVPEFDNDAHSEASYSIDGRASTVDYVYDKAAVYVPYLDLIDQRGQEIRVYSSNVLCVAPTLEQRARSELIVPSPSAPDGSIVKGFQILNLDVPLIRSEAGEEYLAGNFGVLADAGVNLVMFNPILFVRDYDSNVIEPIYTNNRAEFSTPSMDFETLISLCDAAREAGLMTGVRFFLTEAFDGDVSERSTFNPLSDEIYFRYHMQYKTCFAALIERLGVSILSLETENPAFSTSSRAREVIESVRSLAPSLLITDSPSTLDGILYDCPFLDALDVIGVSIWGVLPESETTSEQAEGATRIALRAFDDFCRYAGKPGIVLEYGTETYRRSEASSRLKYEGMLSAFSELQGQQSLVQGITIWDWSLTEQFRNLHSPEDLEAFDVVSRFFGDLIPEQRRFDFSPSTDAPEPSLTIETFERRSAIDELEMWQEGQSVTSSIIANASRDGVGVLRVTTSAQAAPSELMYYFYWKHFSDAQDWTSHETMSIYMKSDGTPSDFLFNVIDADGDRFSVSLNNMYYRDGWALLTARLDEFNQPDWARGSGDGELDWSSVVSAAFCEIRYDGIAHTSYLDDWFLSQDGP